MIVRKFIQRNLVKIDMSKIMNFLNVIVKMVTDVSLSELRTPPTPTVPLFYHSPSVMNTPENFWTIDFEQEFDCDMRALFAEMSSELGSASAGGDAAGSQTASASQDVKLNHQRLLVHQRNPQKG